MKIELNQNFQGLLKFQAIRFLMRKTRGKSFRNKSSFNGVFSQIEAFTNEIKFVVTKKAVFLYRVESKFLAHAEHLDNQHIDLRNRKQNILIELCCTGS